MANILDKYGIKEVADVTFYEIKGDGTKGSPVLYLDTLKVSTIEQTAENSEAKGGKGNPPLIVWDYGKEINVTLEDALFSAKSLSLMFGNGRVKEVTQDVITKTIQWIATSKEVGGGSDTTSGKKTYELPNGKTVTLEDPKYYEADGTEATKFVTGATYFTTGTYKVKTKEIDISPNTFPGTYYVEGETYARSAITGEDESFIFTIPKAKVLAENTITLEAEGDPSVFNMNLRVLRPATGNMMTLKQFDYDDISSGAVASLVG